MLPPRPVRRLGVAPLFVLATLLLVTTLPLWLIGTAFVSPWLPGRWRPLRMLWYFLVHAVVESLSLLALLLLWFATGFGLALRRPWSARAHHALVRLYLIAVVRAGRRVFNLRFDLDAPGVLLKDGPAAPLVVLSRHAGPGDSLLLVHALVATGHRPHIVLRDTLQWAPALDVVLNRLPNLFLPAAGRSDGDGSPVADGRAPADEGRDRFREEITRLASHLGPGDALILFPEGRNFTPARRLSSIAHLERIGDHAAAERARAMRHVLLPRSGGTLAALAAVPDAAVIFVAHTGLEGLSSVVDLWRGTPMDAAIRVKAWRVPPGERPQDPAEGSEWLHSWWRRIDAWILANHGDTAVPEVVADALRDVDPSGPTSDPATGTSTEADGGQG
jgi:1-acyl-sn-glycerol-3-phosphate acyltransferase